MKSVLLRSHSLLLGFALLFAAPAFWGCNTETDYAKSLREAIEQYKVIDEDTIQSYLRRNNYQNRFQRTNSGLYVVPITEGQGTQVTTGKQVRVKYIGRYLSVGAANSIFDNSTENHSSCGCAVFTAGAGAIDGFNEGLLLMRQGDRKLLLIPSRLAYGPSGQLNSAGTGYAILPNAVLAFDVEILSVSQ
jgi:FKBP-type peptidyl-prolyl cis-trans isomerase